MTRRAVFFVLVVVSSGAIAQKAVTANDASCDISVAPAATLLLPYFEVDVAASPGSGETTIFTVTNTSHLPQIARVTLWTDFAYPLFAFNIELAGHDAQSINLYDVLVRGEIVVEARACDDDRVDAALLQRALTVGKLEAAGSSAICSIVGQQHANAIGYATIDVVGSCHSTMPSDRGYFSDDIRFDNVLIGDYLQVNGNQGVAQGETMVHIRAIPEGGHPRDRIDNPLVRVNFPRTFYGRFLHPLRKGLDARQPLPSVFAVRWVDGGDAGFQTRFKIWREGRAGNEDCSVYRQNSHLPFVDIVRFDEEENATTSSFGCISGLPCYGLDLNHPPAGTFDVEYFFGDGLDDAVAGWLYLNLDDFDPNPWAAQAWVIASMRAEGRQSVDFAAAPLGNGCSASIGFAEELGPIRIGPLPNKRK